jgi:hypothetical protein
MRIALIIFFCLLTSSAHADWYWHVMKVVCDKNELRIIDYSAYNELGEARRIEPGAIDVDSLSTWKTTKEELNIPDKPRPYVKVCKIPSGKYKVILTNAGGGYSAPYAVVNVLEISNPKKPTVLIKELHLDQVVENRYEIIFSKEHPEGIIINE